MRGRAAETPPPRNFRTGAANSLFETNPDCLPPPSYEILSPLLIQCEGTRRLRVRLILEGLQVRPDVICLQEHKLRRGRTDRIQKEVWRPAHWITAPAAEGIHAFRNRNVMAGRGGVAIGIHREFHSYITKEGFLPRGRAAWVCLDHPVWGRLGFVGIYGPNEYEGCIILWSELASELDPAYNWTLMGDFNMITNINDQKGGDGSALCGREARMWARLIRKFKLRDSFHPVENTLRFSWDNRRSHRHNPANEDYSRFGPRTLRRLDRIYTPEQSNTFPFSVNSQILPGMAFSDHAPVVAQIKVGDNTRRPSGHRLNAAHLNNPAFRERISALWAERKEVAVARNWSEEKVFQSCMKGTRILDRCWGKRRAVERRAHLTALQARLARAQLALEASPSDSILQQEVQVAVELLGSFEKDNATWVDQVLQERWISEGDRGTRLFFKSFKSMSKGKQIPALRADDGSRITEWESMADLTVKFFQNTLGERSQITAQNPPRCGSQ